MSWRLARSLEQLRTEVLARWPGTTVWTIGDAAHRNRASDHNPNSKGVVTAIDVLGREKAAVMWAHLLERRDERMKYAIFDGQIVSATNRPWQVRAYTGANPHRDHIHVSVGRGRDGRTTHIDLYDDPSSWALTSSKRKGEQMLTNGHRGPAVELIQRCLENESKAADRTPALPRHGVDGHYGDETEAAVRRYQRAARVQPTGNVDGLTAALLVRWE